MNELLLLQERWAAMAIQPPAVYLRVFRLGSYVKPGLIFVKLIPTSRREEI